MRGMRRCQRLVTGARRRGSGGTRRGREKKDVFERAVAWGGEGKSLFASGAHLGASRAPSIGRSRPIVRRSGRSCGCLGDTCGSRRVSSGRSKPTRRAPRGAGKRPIASRHVLKSDGGEKGAPRVRARWTVEEVTAMNAPDGVGLHGARPTAVNTGDVS